jgi:thiol-disulfide isomerase/thioredoxin
VLFLLSLLACDQPIIDDSDNPNVIVQEIEKCIHIKDHKPCDFESFNSDGVNTSLYDLEGSPFILDISAAWCGPCRMAAQEVQEVQDYYSEYDLRYLTLLFENTNGNPPSIQDLKNWKSQNDITTAPVWGGNRSILTPSPINTEEGFYMTSLPTFYFINEDMRIFSMQEGFSSESIYQHIEEMLNE